MHKKKLSKRLWDFGLVYESELLLRMACGRDRKIGYEEVTGDTTDISKWLDFEMYDLVYWIDRSYISKSSHLLISTVSPVTSS